MSKYNYEFKKKVVQEYLAEKYEIGNKDKKQVQKWVKAYEAFGEEGLLRSRKKKKYTFELKLSVVELYLTTEVSYQCI